MKVAVSSIILGAALGVSAHPSGHAHLHKPVARDFVIANKPVTVTEYATAVVAATSAAQVNADAVVPTTTSSPAAVATTSSAAAASSSSSSSGSSGYVAFCSGNSKRATDAEIAYKGNTGTSSDYGCNIMVVDSDIADQYDYTVTFNNAKSSSQECACWNKIGPDGGINGFFTGNEAITFTLPASGTTVVAIDANSQGGCTCGVGSLPLTSIGEFAGTWLEFDMADSANSDWSGADASCLVAASADMDIPGLQVCGSGTCSTIYEGGTGDNAYVAGTEAADGIGLNLAAGNVRLTVSVGYSS